MECCPPVSLRPLLNCSAFLQLPCLDFQEFPPWWYLEYRVCRYVGQEFHLFVHASDSVSPSHFSFLKECYVSSASTPVPSFFMISPVHSVRAGVAGGPIPELTTLGVTSHLWFSYLEHGIFVQGWLRAHKTRWLRAWTVHCSLRLNYY